MGFAFTTPVGRLVYGSVWDGSDRAKDGTQRITKTGPNAGKPLFTWSFGVAFEKMVTLPTGQRVPNQPFNEWYAQIHELARQAWPQYMNGAIDPITGKPGPSHPRFAMKIMDGDGSDGDGKPNNVKEGWAGHWVVKFSSSAGAPRVFDINVGLDPAQQLQDKSRVLPGDYVAVQGSADKNTGDTPGLYMNGNMVCFVGGGTRIVTGPRAADAFAGIAGMQMPTGCVPGASPAAVAAVGAMTPAGVPIIAPPPVVPTAHDPAAKATADGWIVHPQAPGYRYKGQEIKTDAEVFALYPAPVTPPVPLPVASAVPVPPVTAAPAPVVPNHAFVAQAAGVPVITLSPAALAAGYTVAAFEQAGYDYARMKAEGWAL